MADQVKVYNEFLTFNPGIACYSFLQVPGPADTLSVSFYCSATSELPTQVNQESVFIE